MGGQLYAIADVYVTASASEGFGLPVAEAAAAGLLVICPAGGAAEEITDPDFTMYVESTLHLPSAAASAASAAGAVAAVDDAAAEVREAVASDASAARARTSSASGRKGPSSVSALQRRSPPPATGDKARTLNKAHPRACLRPPP